MVDAHIGRRRSPRLTREECAAKLRRRQYRLWLRQRCEGLRTHPALRRVTVETPKGPVSLGAPRRCCRRAAGAGAGAGHRRALGGDPGGIRGRTVAGFGNRMQTL